MLAVVRIQLGKTANRARPGLFQVPVGPDGELAAGARHTMSGLLRSGFVQRRNKSTGEVEVVTAYVLSDDSLTH